jgi:hypothetical protein
MATALWMFFVVGEMSSFAVAALLNYRRFWLRHGGLCRTIEG